MLELSLFSYLIIVHSSFEHQNLEALWLRIPPLAKILRKHFEELWKRGKPLLPILKEIKQRKK